MQIRFKNVKGDGSCMFRSVYASAQDRGLLKRLCRHFQISSNASEDEFILALRQFLSQNVAKGNDFNMIHDIYAYLKDLDNDTFDAYMDSASEWFVETVKPMPTSEKTFRQRVSKGLQQIGNWANQLELDLIRAFLNKSKISIHVCNSENTAKRFFTSLSKADKNTLYILNKDEVHYNAIILDEMILNPATNRYVSKHSCKGYELRAKHAESMYGSLKATDGKILNPVTKRFVSASSCKGYEIRTRQAEKKSYS